MKKNKIAHLFSKIIVVYCIAFASGMCIYALKMMKDTGYDASAIITVGVGFFGGELLFLCLKTIFGEKAKKKDDDENEDEEEAVG